MMKHIVTQHTLYVVHCCNTTQNGRNQQNESSCSLVSPNKCGIAGTVAAATGNKKNGYFNWE